VLCKYRYVGLNFPAESARPGLKLTLLAVELPGAKWTRRRTSDEPEQRLPALRRRDVSMRRAESVQEAGCQLQRQPPHTTVLPGNMYTPTGLATDSSSATTDSYTCGTSSRRQRTRIRRSTNTPSPGFERVSQERGMPRRLCLRGGPEKGSGCERSQQSHVRTACGDMRHIQARSMHWR
jgi:hypothetical protein